MRIASILLVIGLTTASPIFAGGVYLKTVVIDAGHGGKDPGAIGPGKTQEKDVALVVALKLGSYIQRNYPDVQVVYTRKNDTFLELFDRAEVANRNEADLFIAIHCNASTNPQTYGSSTYVLGLHRTEANLEVAKRENAVINLEDNRDKNYEFDPNSPEGHIIMSMKQNAFLDQSIAFASKAENQFESYASRKSLGVKQAGFYVLYKTAMPSVLAEIGFISNPDEEKYLNSSRGQDQIATALFHSFKAYKSELEGAEETGSDGTEETKPAIPSITESKSEVQAASSNKDVRTSEAGDKNNDNGGTGNNEKQTAGDNDKKNPTTNADALTRSETKSPASNAETTTKADAKTEAAQPETVNRSAPAPNGNGALAQNSPGKAEPRTATPITDKGSEKIAPHQQESGIVFKVQLFALKGALKDYEKISQLFANNLSSEVLPNGFTRFYGGKTSSYSEALKFLDIAKKAGYSNAFIAGFNSGTRMTTDEIKTFAK